MKIIIPLGEYHRVFQMIVREGRGFEGCRAGVMGLKYVEGKYDGGEMGLKYVEGKYDGGYTIFYYKVEDRKKFLLNVIKYNIHYREVGEE